MLIRGTSLFGLSSQTRDGELSRCIDALVDKDGSHIETLIFERNSHHAKRRYLVPANLIFPLIPNTPMQMNIFTSDFGRYQSEINKTQMPHILKKMPELDRDSVSESPLSLGYSLKSLLSLEAISLDGPIGKMLDVFIGPTDFEIQFYKIRNDSDQDSPDPSLTISPRWIDHIDWTRGKSHLNLTKNTVSEICLVYPKLPEADELFQRSRI